MLGVTYIAPVAIGGVVGSFDESYCDCRDAYRMFIPIAGPLMLLHGGRRYSELNGLLITTTVLQSAGLVLTIFGIIRYAASAQAAEDYEAYGRLTPNLSWMATPVPGGGYAALSLRL
jgi:hypothetical protein